MTFDNGLRSPKLSHIKGKFGKMLLRFGGEVGRWGVWKSEKTLAPCLLAPEPKTRFREHWVRPPAFCRL